jgi:hypothetical protein
MSRYPKRRPPERVATVRFRPDSRNASNDYDIPLSVAQLLFKEGEIWGDATNGGYMPNPKSRYDVRQHLVPAKQVRR